MRAKFDKLSYEGGKTQGCAAAAEAEQPWMTAEQIPVKRDYTEKDLEGLEHLNYAAGIVPFLRGPYSTMYVMRPCIFTGRRRVFLGNPLPREVSYQR